MTLNEYQNQAWGTAIYRRRGANIVYPTLGLVGEAGEIANKIKKIERDGLNILPGSDHNSELVKELGDVLWYVSAIAVELGYTLDDIAQLNLAKLQKRQEQGKITGSGDNR